jgi:hypothetical protein
MKMDEYLILFFNELDRNGVLSDNTPKWTQTNTVVYQNDKSGPGGSWTHDLSQFSLMTTKNPTRRADGRNNCSYIPF